MVVLTFDTIGASLRASTIVDVLPCMFVVLIVKCTTLHLCFLNSAQQLCPVSRWNCFPSGTAVHWGIIWKRDQDSAKTVAGNG